MNKSIIITLIISLAIIVLSGYHIFFSEKKYCECTLTYKSTGSLHSNKFLFLKYDCRGFEYSTTVLSKDQKYDKIQIGDKMTINEFRFDTKKGLIRAMSSFLFVMGILVFIMSCIILKKKPV